MIQHRESDTYTTMSDTFGVGWWQIGRLAPSAQRDRRVWPAAVGQSRSVNISLPESLPFAMLTIQVRYAGHKKCDLVHPEGAAIRTDAPKDIGGDASAFSPTDLIAAGLAS
jgi:hypothetical protein